MPADSRTPKTRRRKDSGPDRPVMVFPITEVRPGRESIIAGVLGTVLIHLLAFLLIPPFLKHMERDIDVAALPDQAGSELDLQLADDTALVPEQKKDPRYVETNPDAPENTPDKTDAESSRNQVAANLTEARELSKDETPAREGEEKAPFAKPFSGDLNPPVEVVPTPPPTPETEEKVVSEEDQSRQRQAPLEGTGEELAKADEGPMPGVATPTPDARPAEEKIDGKEAGAENGAPTEVTLTAPSRPQPAPRPRLTHIAPGIVNRQAEGVSQTGYVGVNARFSQYGEYMERMVEAVTQRWHKMCADSGHAENSTKVELEFTITRDGTIKNMSTVETTAQALGILLCRTAVESGAPYGIWTKDMVATLGEEQTIRFTFYYW